VSARLRPTNDPHEARLAAMVPGQPHQPMLDRPVVAYLVSGEYTEHRDGLAEVAHKPGEQWVEGTDVVHWSENRGTEPAVLINVEVIRKK
jgi:hypothetical protein